MPMSEFQKSTTMLKAPIYKERMSNLIISKTSMSNVELQSTSRALCKWRLTDNFMEECISEINMSERDTLYHMLPNCCMMVNK